MRINFVWTNGIEDTFRFNHWNDGLRAAMQIIEKEHDVTYHEPYEDLPDADWTFFWEAACTHDAYKYGPMYQKVMAQDQKTALLFAGGPIKYEWIHGFDHIFWESQINGDEFEALGVSNSCAFGINTDIFKPMKLKKEYQTVTHGTCASWKRQWLAGEAIGKNALVFGRGQDSDPRPFEVCRELGCTVLDEQPYEEVVRLLNTAKVSLNLADFWGGGQRQTLEAMACNIPVIVMEDSPKNREYVEEADGVICKPDVGSIKRAVQAAKQKRGQRDYVLSKWTHKHYADALIDAIEGI